MLAPFDCAIINLIVLFDFKGKITNSYMYFQFYPVNPENKHETIISEVC